jgi:hypothetical protein
VKYTTAVLGQNESCGTSIAEESKILLVLFRALKGGKTWFLAREIRLCGLDHRSDVAFFCWNPFVPVLVHSERECIAQIDLGVF